MRNGDDDAAEDTFAELLNGLALSGGARSGRRRRADASRADSSAPTEPMSAPPWHEPGAQAEIQWPQAGYPAETYPVNGYADAYAGYQDDPADQLDGRHDDQFDDQFDEESDAAIVRPYAWTGGRTRSSGHFQMETLVSTTGHGEDEANVAAAEHRSIAELCHEPRSVAEVSALLDVPIGVAKVLLSDMAELGLVTVHRTATGGGNRAHLKLMERVLGGLRRL
jgi:hypothetical protein